MSMVFRSHRMMENLREPTKTDLQVQEIFQSLGPMLTHDNQETDQDGEDFKRVTFKVRKVNLCIRLEGVELV